MNQQLSVIITFYREIHATKLNWAYSLSLEFPFTIDEYGGEVSVWVVGDASGGYALQELGGGELGGQLGQVLIQQSTEWDAGGEGGGRRWRRRRIRCCDSKINSTHDLRDFQQE